MKVGEARKPYYMHMSDEENGASLLRKHILNFDDASIKDSTDSGDEECEESEANTTCEEEGEKARSGSDSSDMLRGMSTIKKWKKLSQGIKKLK